MTLLSTFFKPKVIKHVKVYISLQNSEIMIVPLFQDGKHGIIFEQKEQEIIPYDSPPQLIGEAVKRNFNHFMLKKYGEGSGPASDWAALKASKVKTKADFGKKYQMIFISGANEYNIIFNLRTTFEHLSGLEISSTISAFCDDEELGKRVLRMYNSEICEKQ
jgi:hypothetical protein